MPSSVVPILRRAKGRAVAAVHRWRYSGEKAFWLLADQGVSSLGNFLTNLLLARALGLAEAGLYLLLYELGLFLNSLQAATILFPLNVKGAVANKVHFARIAGRAVVVTLLLAPVLGIGLLATAGANDRLVVGAWAMVALVIFQIQETLRRSLIIQMRYRDAVWGDAVSYLGQATTLYLMSAGKVLTLTTAFQAFAATSAAAGLLQLLQVRPQRVPVREAIHFARSSWQLSRWVLFGNVTNLLTKTLFYWNLKWWAGLPMLGVLLGLLNVLRVSNPLILAFGSVIVPTIARARGRQGLAGAKRLLLTYVCVGVTALLLLFAVPMAAPEWVLRLFYQGKNVENYLPFATELRLLTVMAIFMFLMDAMGSFLMAVERPRLTFRGNATYAALIAFVAMPLTAVYGLRGFAIGGLLAAAGHALVNAVFVTRLSEDSPRDSARDGARDGESGAGASTAAPRERRVPASDASSAVQPHPVIE